jgi:hypothetical protein
VFTSFSWVDARLLTPAAPGADRLPDVADYVHQIGIESGIPLRGGTDRRLVASADLSLYGPRSLNTTGSLSSERYERLTFRGSYERSRYRVWLGGLAYPGSVYGESAYLFGSRVGVRPNPRVSFESGIAYVF